MTTSKRIPTPDDVDTMMMWWKHGLVPTTKSGRYSIALPRAGRLLSIAVSREPSEDGFRSVELRYNFVEMVLYGTPDLLGDWLPPYWVIYHARNPQDAIETDGITDLRLCVDLDCVKVPRGLLHAWTRWVKPATKTFP